MKMMMIAMHIYTHIDMLAPMCIRIIAPKYMHQNMFS